MAWATVSSGAQANDALNVARCMKNTDDLQWFCFVPIDHQVRIDEEEQMTLVDQFFVPMADAAILHQLDHRRFESIENTSAASMLSSAM